MTWVVVDDPIPAGASHLGDGPRARVAHRHGRRAGGRRLWPAFEEKSFESFRAYYDYVPKGSFTVEYTVRLNQGGRFELPADARRGALRAGDVRRAAEPRRRGGAVTRPRALAFLGIALALGWVALPTLADPGRRRAAHARLRRRARGAIAPSDLLLLDRHGEVIHEVRTDPRRRRLGWTPLDEVSPALRSAVLASEDRRFHDHGGVDGRAVVAAGASAHRGGTSSRRQHHHDAARDAARPRAAPPRRSPARIGGRSTEVAADAARVADRGAGGARTRSSRPT